MPNVEHFHQDASSATLVAHVFQPDYSERLFFIALSDVGHLGLYTGACSTMVAGDLVQIYDSSITKYIGAYRYEPNSVPTAATIADAVWDEAVSGHTTTTTFGGKNQVVVPSTLAADITTLLADTTNIVFSVGGISIQLNTKPTITQLNARTLVSADYVVVTDTIAGVTLVGTCTTNTDLAAVKTETDKIASLVTAVITNADGTDIAADIITIKDQTDKFSFTTYYVVSGTLTPDATGDYIYAGTYGGDSYYKKVGADFYIWWCSAASYWIISTTLGTDESLWHHLITITGTYSTDGSGSGTATVTAVNGVSANVNNEALADINAECDTAITDAVLATATNLATVDTVVDAIKAKTDQLAFTASTVDANIATGGLGTGSVQMDYYVFTNETAETGAIANVSVYVSSDEAGTTVVASGMTDTNGKVTFYLEAGYYYMWRSKAGYSFSNPDLESVSA